jgi:diguanylate cyclase (GGDEF)-like protein/PAS domain S-box-containing protein
MTRRSLVDIAVTGVLAAAYLAAGKFGLSLAFVNTSATLVWPPTGIAIASLLLLGYRFWPGVLIGAFLVNVTTSGSIATSIGIASGNTLEAILAAYLVNKLANGRNALDRPADVFKFAGLAAMLSTTVSATLGVSSLLLGGLAGWTDYRTIWLTWWLGDAVGALVVSPVIILWALEARWTWNRPRFFEGTALLLFLLLVGSIVFTGWLLPNHGYPLEFICIPPLVWAGFRFRRRGAATLVFVLSIISIWGTLRGYGPFARESPNESLLLLQAFMGVISIMTLALAAVVAERRRAEGTLLHLASIVESSSDAIIGKNLDGVILSWNSGAEKIYGYAADEAVGKDISLLTPPNRLDEIRLILEKVKRGERVEQYETKRVTKRGQEIDVSLTVSPTRNASGQIQGASVIARDLSERKRFEARLVHLADHDALTDLVGRRRFQFEIGRQLALSQRYGTTGAVIFVDLDDFKCVNDTLGHGAGDRLLMSLSRLLRGRLRKADLLARLGGDEFAVLAPQTNSDQASQLARQLLLALGQHVTVLDDGRSVGVTASVGIALFPEHGSTVEALLARADRAMYQAKRAGGNRFIVHVGRGDLRDDNRFDDEESVGRRCEGDSWKYTANPSSI